MKILVGIVLFKPDIDRLVKNIYAICSQVDCALLINNDSPDLISLLEEKLSYGIDFNVINNKKNLGIAVALNQLLEYAHNNSYDWILVLDQDSIAPSNMIKEYKKFFDSKDIGIICPKIFDVNNNTNVELKKKNGLIYNEEDVITSGSCINVNIAVSLNGFDERLFIDFVDTDFQKRLLLAGYKIVRVNDVVLTHEIGKIKTIKLLGHNIICTNHSSFRRYYQVRNRLYFKARYYGFFALVKEKIRLALGTIKIILFEDDKKEKFVATINGFRDFKKLLNKAFLSRIKVNKIRISFVLPSMYGTGGIKVAYEYARRLKQHGHCVTVYVPIKAYNMHKGNVLLDFIKQVYATLLVIKNVFIDKLTMKVEKENNVRVKTVWKISNKFVESADVIIATAWCTAFDVNELDISKGKKIYFVQDYEIWDNAALGKKSYTLPLQKIVIAKWIKERLVLECGCKNDEIIVINNGIDTKKFFPQKKERNKKSIINCLMLDHSLEKKGVKYEKHYCTYINRQKEHSACIQP